MLSLKKYAGYDETSTLRKESFLVFDLSNIIKCDAAPGKPGGMDAAPIPGLSCSVWIVGSSIVRNAGIAALSRPGGQGLGLQTKGIDIWWQGYGGCDLLILPANSDG
eukprot:XP_019919976.1 PREDICTED: uncharacterized protein LOC109617745 [Crassostrea gigas]